MFDIIKFFKKLFNKKNKDIKQKLWASIFRN